MNESEQYSKLLRGIRSVLKTRFGEYPEFTDARIRCNHWEVFVLGTGWVRTTDFLNQGSQGEIVKNA